MKKVLVLGGNRYFGKRLIELLLKAGHDVTILNRGNAKDPFGDQVQRLKADRTDARALNSAVQSCSWDIVYDQICYSSQEASDAVEIFRDRVGHYIHTSTQSVYVKNGEVREEDFDPYHYSTALSKTGETNYGEGKRRAEAVFFQKASFPVTAVRFPIVLGPDDYTGRLEFHLNRIKAGKEIIVPDPAARVSLIHSEDAADFLFWLSGKNLEGPVNACSTEALPMSDILAMIEHFTGKTALVSSSGADENSTPFTGEASRFMNPQKALQLGFRFKDVRIWLPELIELKGRPFEKGL